MSAMVDRKINPASEGCRDLFRKPILILSRWDLYAICIFLFVLVLQVLNWPNFPLFLDCYYHLSVMRGFSDAGGWVGVSFWEYAPFGRPHLYPPLFHILELAVFKLGFSPITVARLFDFLIYPFFIFVNWRILRGLFSKELAFFNLILLISSYPFYLAIVNNIPFTLALLFGLASFHLLHKDKFFGSVLCLALSFYTHTMMAWIVFSAILLYGFLNPRIRKPAFWVCLAACALAAPFLYHQASYYLFLHQMRLVEFFFFSAHPILFILAIFGFIIGGFNAKTFSINRQIPFKEPIAFFYGLDAF